jgi:Uncharacterized protein conserved in bacteria (DUF2252)
MTGIVAATRRYERWLATLVTVDRGALAAKHAAMAESAQAFLRATYFRWCELWPLLCPERAAAPRVLAVGDVHVENFGTSRDAKGRRVWGINDADEASALAYPNDLVRLVASALCEIAAGTLELKPRACADAVLEGYAKSLSAGGTSFVLDDWPRWLSDAERVSAAREARFWRRLDSWPSWRRQPPHAALRAIRATLPDTRGALRFVRRRSGLGSLGRPRVTAIGVAGGAPIARDAKPVLPSAAGFVAGQPRAPQVATLLARARRPRDPFLLVRDGWLVRRLAPDIVRADFAELRAPRHERALLRAMGAELANLHLATPRAAPAILRDLARRDAKWLKQAAQRMRDALDDDRLAWCRR